MKPELSLTGATHQNLIRLAIWLGVDPSGNRGHLRRRLKTHLADLAWTDCMRRE